MRYLKNIGTYIPKYLQKDIRFLTVGIIGVGGNGGYIAEFLTRLGVKKIILFDGDRFETSNLNRQLYSNLNTINHTKTDVTKQYLNTINPEVSIVAYNKYLCVEHINILKMCDYIFDCTSREDINISLKKQLFSECVEQGKSIYILNGNLKQGCFSLILDSKKSKYFYQNFCKEVISPTNEKDTISQPAFLCAEAASFATQMMIDHLINKYNINYLVEIDSLEFFMKKEYVL